MGKNKRSMANKKALIVFLVVILMFIYAISALVKWQLVMGEELKTLTLEQSLRSTELSAMRGTIYDTTGDKILAQSASVWDVVLDPNQFGSDTAKKDITASGLASILGLEYEYIRERLDRVSNYEKIASRIEVDTRDTILTFLSENEIETGVTLEDNYKRYYPYGSTASVVIGFTGSDNIGLEGLEYQYNDLLSGTTGQMVSFKNAIGLDMPVQYDQLIEAEAGHDLVLTIDETVQSIVEKHLQEGIEQYKVEEGATAVVMDVNTGAIIALATGSDYDLNDPYEITDEAVIAEINELPDEEQSAAIYAAQQEQWRNKAVSDTYYPGSVFKPVSSSMALDSGAITLDTTFECTGSHTPVSGGSNISCWYVYGHGVQTVREGVSNSCNPFMMQMAERLGIDMFYEYFQAFGFTEKTGIDLPGEATGVHRTGDEMDATDLAVYAFGQNFGITPIQMITATAAVANGGYLVQPHVVDRVLDSDGNIVQQADTSYKRQVISTEVATEMADIMYETATIGSAKNGNVPGYKIAGKTGTSEKIDEWARDPDEPKGYIVSYCGFAPADDPQYACLVYFDEPTEGKASSSLQAAPTFSLMMKEILPYLGVEMDLSGDDGSGVSQVSVPDVLGKTLEEAKEIVEEKGLSFEVYGDDSDTMTIVAQTPSAGTLVQSDGQVILYTEADHAGENMVEVPDFTGMTVSACNEEIASLGLQMMYSGAATSGTLLAGNQDIPAGSLVEPGTVITITFLDQNAAD